MSIITLDPVEIDGLVRQIAVLRLDSSGGGAPCYDVTFLECGHNTTFVVWPIVPKYYCAQCLHETLKKAMEHEYHRQ